MKRSEMTDILVQEHIINTFDVLRRFADKGKDIACSYFPKDNSRGGRSARVTVFSPSHQTDPSAHWLNRGCKTFLGKKNVSLPLALAWAQEKYGISEWSTVPTRTAKDLVPKIVHDRLMRYIHELRRNTQTH